jgi:hypothetical protein
MTLDYDVCVYRYIYERNVIAQHHLALGDYSKDVPPSYLSGRTFRIAKAREVVAPLCHDLRRIVGLWLRSTALKLHWSLNYSDLEFLGSVRRYFRSVRISSSHKCADEGSTSIAFPMVRVMKKYYIQDSGRTMSLYFMSTLRVESVFF